MYEKYIEEAIANRKIPGAAWIVEHLGKNQAYNSAGSFWNQNEKEVAVSVDTLFDLASLTKVMCTLPAILYLQEKKQLNITDSLTRFLPAFPYKAVTLEHLLQHTSGIANELTYKSRFETRNVVEEILQCQLIRPPGRSVVYSDLGMILLGKVVELVTNTPLQIFTEKTLFEPWEMHKTGFLPEMADINQIAATEKVSNIYVHGDVHDEKTVHLGGVSGAAGLFSTVADVGRFVHYWLYPEKQAVLHPYTMALVHKSVKQNRGLAFEVVGQKSNALSCGTAWSIGSFGHTGFTGTSLWIDPKEEIAAVLLTNAVHFGRDHGLSQIRKDFHTLIHKQFVG